MTTDVESNNRRLVPSDEKNTLNIVRDEPRDVPAADIFDEPLVCMTFNQEWRPHVTGAIETLSKWTAWNGVEDETNEGTQQILRLLAQDYECVDCPEPDPCTIEELLADDDFFNDEYLPATFGEYYSATTANETTQAAAYDGTPQSIAPDAPAGTPNAIEKNALCAAVHRFVALYASTKLCLIQSKNFVEILWTKLAGAANDFYDVVSNLMSPIYSPNIFSCFVSDAAAITALQNDAAIEELACHIYDELKTVTMSQSNFDAAITDAATSLSGDAADIACLMLNDNSLSLYINMLESYNIQLTKQANNDDVDCPCESDTYWMKVFDFSLGQQNWRPMNGATFTRGLYLGSYFGNNTANPPNNPETYIVHSFGNAYVIRACGIDYEVAGHDGNGSDGVFCRGWQLPEQGGSERFTGSTSFLNVDGRQTRDYRDLTESLSSQSYTLQISANGTPSGSNWTRIHRVVIYGLPNAGNKPTGSVWVSGVPTSPAPLFPA